MEPFSSPTPVPDLVESYQVQPDELALFVDESGDARLKDPNNRLFILAACITIGGSMDSVAEEWSEIRNSILGDRNKPIHFSEIKKRLRRRDRESRLRDFFNNADVGRIGVCISENNGFDLCSDSGTLIIRAAFDELLHQQARLINRKYDKILVVFEDSKIMRHVYNLCRALTLERSDGFQIPVQFFRVTKENKVPWLEIADGIAHTLAGDIRTAGEDEVFAARSLSIFAPKNGAPAVKRNLIASFTKINNTIEMKVKES